MFCFQSAAFVAVALATSAAALPQARPESSQGQPQRFALDYATGHLVAQDSADAQRAGTAAATVSSYVNDCTNGFFVAVGPFEMVDWGVKSGGASTVVDGFSFGYSTSSIDPSFGGPGADFEVAFYQGTTGFGALGPEVARFEFVGLPGSLTGGFTPYVIDVDLSGGSEFCLPDGPIGYGFCSSSVAPTGPSLVDVLACLNGTANNIDQYDCPAAPSNYDATFNFGGPPNPSTSFYMEIREDDGLTAAATAVNAGAGVNLDVLSDGGAPPVLNAAWPLSAQDGIATHSLSSAVWFAGSLPPGALTVTNGLGTFEVIVDPTSAFGLSQTVVGAGGVYDHAVFVPKDTNLVGLGFTVQSVQLGGGPAYSLSNALDVVVGF